MKTKNQKEFDALVSFMYKHFRNNDLMAVCLQGGKALILFSTN